MASKPHECPFCGRKDFKSSKGLTQHQNRSQHCTRQACTSVYGKPMTDFSSKIFIRATTTSFGSKRQKIASHCRPTSDVHGEEDINFATFLDLEDQESVDSVAPCDTQTNHEICTHSRTYVAFANQRLLPFSRTEATALRLLFKLGQTKASLNTYESIMEWHLRETKKLQNWQSLADSEDYISQEKLFRWLKKGTTLITKTFFKLGPTFCPIAAQK